MAYQQVSETPPKNAVIALVLSLVIPGAGQIYNGHVPKGILLIVGYVIGVVLAVTVILACVGAPAAIAIWIYAMVDAYKTAERINRETAGPMKQCSFCAVAIPVAAIVCPNCHRDLPTAE